VQTLDFDALSNEKVIGAFACDMNDDGFNDLVVTVHRSGTPDLRIFLFDNGQFSSSSRSLSFSEGHQ
jgi:hypothetical protein